MATIQNITIDQDADFTETLTIKDSTGTVVDLTGSTITSKLRKTHLSSSSTTFTTAIVSATEGTCSITLTDTVTSGLTEGRYVWDLTKTDGSGIITRRIEGRATVTPSVTRYKETIMAVPNTKATLKEYCLRSLGKPVIDINVDDEQVDDRIDEAVQYFCQYHSDGVERMYLKYEVTADDITRMTADTSESITENSVTTTWKQGNNFLIVPETVISVVNVFPLSDRANLNMFDVRYQLRLNDLYDFSSTSIVHYEMTMKHLDFLDHILVGENL